MGGKILRFGLVVVLLATSISFVTMARDLDPDDVLSQRFGKSTGEISQSISQFESIDSGSVVNITLAPPARPDDFAAAEAYFESFRRNYPKAKFTPSQEGIAAGEYVVFVTTIAVSDRFDRNLPDFTTQATGIECTPGHSGGFRCRQTGQRRVQSGTTTTTMTASIHGVSVYMFLVGNDGALEDVRTGSSTLSLTGDDNCRNIGNVYVGLAYLLGGQPLSSRPERVSFRAYPNQFGCYDKDSIKLK